MNDLNRLCQAVQPLHDDQLRVRVGQRLDRLTKPLGALGRIESLALRLACMLGTESPQLREPQMLVCAADHGLAAQGVSAYPVEVTHQMVLNMLAGGAAVSVLARQQQLALTVVDCGVRGPLPEQPGLLRRWVPGLEAGTQDSSQGPAMSEAQALQALQQGAAVLQSLPGNVLLLGEMGIGNTSAAALLMARLTGLPLLHCVGAGTGLGSVGLARKQAVLAQVLARHAAVQGPLPLLAALGGLEIATLAGAVLQAASERRVVLVDGFITTAAVAVAEALAPGVLAACVFAHASAENGHARWLTVLQAKPLLDLGLRLGEGSGAALAWPLLPAACALLNEMASFESAGVSDRVG